MERAGAVRGRQASAADQFQDQPIRAFEVDRLRRPGIAKGEVGLAGGIALQRRTCQQPVGCHGEAVGRHVEGQVHAAHRVGAGGPQLQPGPADLHGVAVHRQLQDLAEVRADLGDI